MAEQSSFCVFRYITIPSGSLITKAHIYFYSYDTRSGIGIDADIHFADEDNSQPPTDKTDLDGRSVTASVSWPSIEDWYDNKVYRTPDLRDILQEVMDRSGWAENNNVMAVLKVTDGPDSGRFWSAREYLEGVEKACLRVWWRPAEQIQTPYIIPAVEFQLDSFNCSISTYPTDADIYYTLDGSDPDQGDTLYSAPFEITGDTVVKAKAYKNYWIPSEIASRDYTVLGLMSVGTFTRLQSIPTGTGVGVVQGMYNGQIQLLNVEFPVGAQLTGYIWNPATGNSTKYSIPTVDVSPSIEPIDYEIDPVTGKQYFLFALHQGGGLYTSKVLVLNSSFGVVKEDVFDTDVSAGYQGLGCIRVDRNGNYHAVWTEYKGFGNGYDLRYYTDAGGVQSETIGTGSDNAPVGGIMKDEPGEPIRLTFVNRHNYFTQPAVKTYEGYFGNWTITSHTSDLPGGFGGPVRNGTADWDIGESDYDEEFLYVDIASDQLKKFSKPAGGSWADGNITSIDLENPLIILAALRDSSGDYHVHVRAQPPSTNWVIGYGSDSSGSWKWYYSFFQDYPGDQVQGGIRSLDIREDRGEVYIASRLASGGAGAGTYITVIDI